MFGFRNSKKILKTFSKNYSIQLLSSMKNNSINIFCFHGKPCAGKDSQAERLAEQFSNSIIISTGEIFRGAKTKEGKFGKYYEALKEDIEIVNAGGLIRDHVIVKIVGEVIEDYISEGKRTFLFTGFPRTIPQAKEFNTMLDGLKNNYDTNEKHIFLKVSNKIAEERAQRRREKDILRNRIPRKEDEPTSFSKRLADFKKFTLPMIKQIGETKKVITLNSIKTKDEVFVEILTSLGLIRSFKERR